ncbi:MAG TPA: hypothetical protein PK733_13340 [Clostridiales bacterium]|nr:hypothetical protein [Clostridiales bacterium]
MGILFMNLMSYKLLLREYLQHNNYREAKMADFIEWIQLRNIHSTSEYLN